MSDDYKQLLEKQTAIKLELSQVDEIYVKEQQAWNKRECEIKNRRNRLMKELKTVCEALDKKELRSGSWARSYPFEFGLPNTYSNHGQSQEVRQTGSDCGPMPKR